MPRARRLTRSTPFRLAVAFAILFVVAFVAAGTIVYQVMSSSIADRLDETVLQTYGVLATAYAQDDLEDLVASVDSHAAVNAERDRIFALADAAGERLAGNAVVLPSARGFSTLSARDLDLPGDRTYRVYSDSVGSNTLLVGASYDETDELETIVLVGFGWATVIAVALAIAGGAVLAAKVQRRLDAIAATMSAVSQGKLAARIPLVGNGDDIDAVSSRVNAALDRLAHLVEGMRQVSSDIAHDLKTPLNRLQIVLEGAALRPPGSDLSSCLAEAQAEVVRVNATFDALLRIAQIEAGARKARFMRVDLNDVVDNIAEVYREVAADDAKVLTAALSGAPAIVSGDADLLIQLFANLVENALRHCPAGTAVFIGVSERDGSLTVEVRDNGPGIPAFERDKVFRRLYRMDKSRSTPGSGLGLSMAKAIADLHDAAISLEDASPGLRVRVRFR